MSSTALPSQSTDFPAWYGEVVRRAGLAENAAVRGAMVIKPHGYAIWEAIQRELDDRIKASGHENIYLPLFVPVSMLGQAGRLAERFGLEAAAGTPRWGQLCRLGRGGCGRPAACRSSTTSGRTPCAGSCGHGSSSAPAS